MNKIKFVSSLIAFSLLSSLNPGLAKSPEVSEADSSQESAAAVTALAKPAAELNFDSMSEKERSKERDKIEVARLEQSRSRQVLLVGRQKISRRLSQISKEMTELSTAQNRTTARAIEDKLLAEELDLEVKLIEEDLAILALEKERLETDNNLFVLDTFEFEQKYQDLKPLVPTVVDSLKGIDKSDASKKLLSKNERALLADFEPAVIVYWGRKRTAINRQVHKTREQRLELWSNELDAHKLFLTAKQEDYARGTKRTELRQKLLKDYFRIKESRQRLSNELVRLENESWQTTEKMKYELGSVYRRIAYLNRISKSKKSAETILLAGQYGKQESDQYKVGEFSSGIVFDALYNWGSRVASVSEGTAAQKAGLSAGDELVYVGDAPVLGAERGFKSLLRGPEDKEVVLTVLRQGELYKFPISLDFRPVEKTHPQLLAMLKEARKSGDSKKIVSALLLEIDYKTKYARDHSVADDTVEEVYDLISKNQNLDKAVLLSAYVACSKHYLNRMSECLTRAKYSKGGSTDTSDSADFLNRADEAVKKILDITAQAKDLSILSTKDLISLAQEYRKHFDFRHIGSPQTLKDLSDCILESTKEQAQSSYYEAASILSELSEIYELTLKDYKNASNSLSLGLQYYLKVIPQESQEVTRGRLALSRNYDRAGQQDLAIEELEARLDSLDAISDYSRKAEESGMYDQVTTLRELGRLYREAGDFQDALSVASRIIDIYTRLGASEDDTFVNALFLSGKSSLETGKAKKAIPYLTDALKSLDSEDKASCILDLASAYQSLSKPNEVRLLCTLLKDYLQNQLAVIDTVDDARKVGDRAVEAAQLLDLVDQSEEAVDFLDLALKAYTSAIPSSIAIEDAAKTINVEELSSLAKHLVRQTKIFDDILVNAGREARASSLKKYRIEIETKLSSGENIDAAWLVRLCCKYSLEKLR